MRHWKSVGGAALVSAAALLTGCESGQSQAERIYNFAAGSWDEYKGYEGHKAKYCNESGCSTVWGRDSAGEAARDASARCEATYGAPCYQFAVDGQLSTWAREISDRYGQENAGSTSSGGSGDGDNGPSAADILGTLTDILTTATGIIGGSSGYSGGGGGSSGGARRSAGNSICPQLLAKANECKARYSTAASGQGASFQQCYSTYMSHYNANCR